MEDDFDIKSARKNISQSFEVVLSLYLPSLEKGTGNLYQNAYKLTTNKKDKQVCWKSSLIKFQQSYICEVEKMEHRLVVWKILSLLYLISIDITVLHGKRFCRPS